VVNWWFLLIALGAGFFLGGLVMALMGMARCGECASAIYRILQAGEKHGKE